MGRVSATQDGCGGCALAKGAEDCGLERVEGRRSFGFRFVISRDSDVNDAAGRNVWREEDGREFNLEVSIQVIAAQGSA